MGMRAPITCEPTKVARRPISGTPQQEAFWDELLYGDDNLVLEARAGTGKSTSCREGMWRLIEANTSRPAIRYCCFNRAIADEFRSKCPPGVEVGTLHSFAYRGLAKAFGCKDPSPEKSYQVMDSLEGAAKLKRWHRKSVARTVSLAKNLGFDVRRPVAERCAILDSIIVEYDVESYGSPDLVSDWADDVLAKSAEWTGIVDFDDMLWLAWLHGVHFQGCDYLFIDESQDLSPVQRYLVPRLNPDGRTVAVGDPFQAIYGFRGADTESIARLTSELSAAVLPLTVTFRCPKSHVELARDLVEDFEAAPSAPMGILDYRNPDAIESAEPGDLVICRCNAPVVSGCLRAIAARRPAFVRGRAIGEQLNSIVRRIEGVTIVQFLASLARWRDGRIASLSAKDGMEDKIEAVTDQAACLEAVAESCGSPAEIPGVIRDLFEDTSHEDRITFSSVHRAKGSEARTVYVIQVPYNVQADRYGGQRPVANWELDQRRNLRYVSYTRSLDSLFLVEPRQDATKFRGKPDRSGNRDGMAAARVLR